MNELLYEVEDYVSDETARDPGDVTEAQLLEGARASSQRAVSSEGARTWPARAMVLSSGRRNTWSVVRAASSLSKRSAGVSRPSVCVGGC